MSDRERLHAVLRSRCVLKGAHDHARLMLSIAERGERGQAEAPSAGWRHVVLFALGFLGFYLTIVVWELRP